MTRIAPDRLSPIRAQLRAHGLRSTPARMQVLLAVREADAPVSHAELADRLAHTGIDQATVFRNLATLAEAGLLRRNDHGDHVWRFEVAREDHHEPTETHAHFTCTACGVVACLPEVQLRVLKRADVPESVRSRQVDVQVRGICDACA